MTDLAEDLAADLARAERWFVRQGLPWFADRVDARIGARLRWTRLVPLLGGAFAAGAFLVVIGEEDLASGALVVALTVLTVLAVYAAGPLRGTAVVSWALRQVVAELYLVLPLVTRALPLLLLFMTFLFVNTEVWQVASSLPRPALYTVVLLFVGVAVMFLLTRLPEEVRRVRRQAVGESLARACRGTPLEAHAERLAARPRPDPSAEIAPLTATQQANLLLVLLVTQALQVLLLALAVYTFFVLFGLIAIRPSVVEAWLGHGPTPITWAWHGVSVTLPVSSELYQVSVFLSAFAGLYFTVYAISDAAYREQFFTELAVGLERAIGVREVYRILSEGADSPIRGHRW